MPINTTPCTNRRRTPPPPWPQERTRNLPSAERRLPKAELANNIHRDHAPAREQTSSPNTAAKVFYRPIEVAIHWAGLSRHESRILQAVGTCPLPDNADFPRWPELRLNAERVRDALVNGDLPYGKNGVTCNDPSVLSDPDLTIRHVDLRIWMARYYPNQRPAFLFDEIERQHHPAISMESMRTLSMDREALKIQLTEQLKAYEALQAEFQALKADHEARDADDKPVCDRSENTYQNIIGGLLTLLLGKSPGGKPYSSFETQSAVIDALLGHYEGLPGITLRTLSGKFAEAREHIAVAVDSVSKLVL